MPPQTPPGPAPLRPRTVGPVSLAAAFAGLDVRLPRDADSVAVTGVSLDSRTVATGELYVALPGSRAHGAAFAGDAAARGAAAVLTDPEGVPACTASGLPTVVADDPRRIMAAASARVFPSGSLTLFGITGTNGKTTTAFLLEAALRAAGHRVGTVGTIGFRLDGEALASGRTTVTTPESPDLMALLAVFAERGARDVVMEVSSHALALRRVDGVHFAVAAFMNLGRDHLDFHHTMEAYFEAKAMLFEPGRCDVAVVNVDDPYGRRLADRVTASGAARLVTTGTGEGADYRILGWQPTARGSRVEMATPTGNRRFDLGMPGDYNVRNAVAALAMAEAAGVDLDAAASGLADAQVPGRMQVVDLGPGAPRVVVDFAHTPQAIESVLSSLPPGGPVVAVVGAGGDRDVYKRGPMGASAGAGADVVIVTDDNPRTEDPAGIRAGVLEGARTATRPRAVLEVPDRRGAITEGLRRARPHGIVAILGKGHEQGQEVGGRVLPFDDVAVARECWAVVTEEAR
ncbi:MAG TPA: UDP-N-acetylmuramoyl-L-alanyl-D-glutamate--2,6-diaminopimelate ligase [Propionibacteriaceae bacterium]|nr:UDP-N-acetylmuramoyl-L-alanyl-D-glutamate--2,6-diaminopimelate ligase [Propionibacteriaceae bacterium]